MMDLHLYRLDDGCFHVMAASSPGVALREGRAVYSIGEDEPDEPVDIEAIPDDKPFAVGYPDGLEPPYPEGAEVDTERNRVTAPARVWAEFCGEGVCVSGEEY